MDSGFIATFVPGYGGGSATDFHRLPYQGPRATHMLHCSTTFNPARVKRIFMGEPINENSENRNHLIFLYINNVVSKLIYFGFKRLWNWGIRDNVDKL